MGINDDGQCNDCSDRIKKISDRFIKWTFITIGTFFVGLGIIGIFLPLLPTTPFFLLAAVCYARSSKKFYDWLLNNKWFGSYINYREGKGVSLRVKILSVSLLWSTIIYSAFFIVQVLFIKIILILIAFGVTVHLITLRTLKATAKEITDDT